MNSLIGDILKQLVREKGLEQQEVAIALGMKPPTFNGYVSNKREPSIAKLIQFATYFDVSVDYLIGYSKIKNPYLNHLSKETKDFIMDCENQIYLELAKDIKERTKADGYKSIIK